MSYVLAGSAVVSAGLGAYKAIKGGEQSSQTQKMAKNNIFTPEEMPAQVGQATDLAARNYTNGMPGTADATNNINRNAASSFYRGSQGATSGGDILDLATRIGLGTNAATNQLGEQEATYKSGALGEYEGALGNQANWQSKLYNNNTLQPYIRTANLAASMYGAGQQNLYSGLDDIGSTAIGYAKATSGNDNGNSSPQTMGQKYGTPQLPVSNGGMGSYVAPQMQPFTPYVPPNNLNG